MASNNARDRAEELLGSLQKRARDFLEAEEGLVRTARELMESRGLSPAEVRERLEEVVGRIKANKVWDRIKTNDRVVALSDYDYRGELDKLLSKVDIEDLAQRVKKVERKIAELTRKVA